MPANDHDCIIIGGGRTRHALHLENYLGLEATSGKELVDTGIRQIKSFRVEFSREQVSSLQTDAGFTVGTERDHRDFMASLEKSSVKK